MFWSLLFKIFLTVVAAGVVFAVVDGLINEKSAQKELKTHFEEIIKKNLENGNYTKIAILNVCEIEEDEDYTCVTFEAEGTDLKYGLKSKDGTSLREGDRIYLTN